MLNKLFESLDEKVFTAELKSELSEQFESAVEIKAQELNSKFITESEVKQTEILAEKLEEKIQELEEKAEEFKSILEAEAKEKEENLLDHIDAYLEKVVEEFIVEAKDSLDESIKAEKADMIIEAMDAMLVATGTNIVKIVEAKDSSDAEVKLQESIKKYDVLIEENIALDKEVNKLMRMGIISEMKEGLSMVEAEKFGKLADLVEFTKSMEYINKLETIKESMSSVAAKTVTEQKEIITEKVQAKETKQSLTTSFNHLI